MNASLSRRGVVLLAVTALYFAAGRLGLSLAVVHLSASAVWPPTGIALASCLIFGAGVWPAIFAGAFLVNVTTSPSAAASLGIAAGNTLEAVAGAWLVSRFAGGRRAPASVQGIFELAGFAAIATMISATVGVASLSAAGLVEPGQRGSVWLTWWLGDAAGAIVFAPLLLLWAAPQPDDALRRRPLEAAGLLATLVVTALVVFGLGWPLAGAHYALEFLCVPVLLWAAFRFGPRETATACVALSGLAVWGTMRGLGPFGRAAPNEALLLLQAFMGVITVALLAVAAEVAQRRGTEAEVRLLNKQLERRIAARTDDVQKAHARLLDAQEVAHVGSWEWDIGANTLWWSEELFRIYGVDSSTLTASYEGFLERLHPDDRSFVEATVRRALEDHRSFAFEHRIVRPDGTVRVLLGRGRVVCDADGRPIRMLGTGQDITEQKKAEEQRAQLIREQAARREAEEASRLKDEFLATLSHELRTPLNAIVGWAHMLLRNQLNEGGRSRAVQTIYRNALVQQRLVSDILDVSRIASGTLRLAVGPVEVASLIESAFDAVRPSAQAKDVRLETDASAALGVITGDEQRLRQVLCNLLDNAIKFSAAGGQVRLCAARTGAALTLAVEDEGPGIAPEFLPHVFEQFRQADSSPTREYAGLGLGLSIVRHIVELHGGQVSAANREESRGAVFVVALPARTPVTEADAARQV